MHKITQTEEGYDIMLTRGDSLLLDVGMTKSQQPYTPQEGETVRFAMKQTYKDADSAVKINKQIPIGTMRLELLPTDTKNLKMGKTYVYDIQYTDSNGRVDTFIKGNLTLTDEVI